MIKENLKNYSIRLGSEEVQRLDALAKVHFYWKRSGIIRGILLAVFRALSDAQIYDLVRYGYNTSWIEIKVDIKISK